MRYYPATKRQAQETMKHINPRRGALIDKEVRGKKMTDTEKAELIFLQAMVDWCVHLLMPNRMAYLRKQWKRFEQLGVKP